MSRMLLGHSGLEQSISDTVGKCIHNLSTPTHPHPLPGKNTKILDLIMEETKILKMVLKN